MLQTEVKIAIITVLLLTTITGSSHMFITMPWDQFNSFLFLKLGQGDTRQQTRPVYITELSDKRCISVVCGHYHSLALSADHRVWSWGWGVHGQLGVGSIEDVLLPTHIKGLDKYEVIQLAAGYSHSAALSVQVCCFSKCNAQEHCYIHSETADWLVQLDDIQFSMQEVACSPQLYQQSGS